LRRTSEDNNGVEDVDVEDDFKIDSGITRAVDLPLFICTDLPSRKEISSARESAIGIKDEGTGIDKPENDKPIEKEVVFVLFSAFLKVKV